MDDGEIAVLTADSVDVFDDELLPVEKTHSLVDWDVSAAEKGGYAHFMAKEIMEQPEAVRKTISPRIRDGRVVLDDLHLTAEYVRDLSRIYVIACGSSYHVGVVSKYSWEKLLGRPVGVVLASGFRYCDPLVDEKTLVIVISQSGETLDTMAAMREAKRRGGRTLAIVNVVGSSIAREADDVLYTWAGPEIAVATTKAYTTQLVLMDLVGPIWRTCWVRWNRASMTPFSPRCNCCRRRCASSSPTRRTSSITPPGTSTTTPSSSSAGTWTTPWAWRVP